MKNKINGDIIKPENIKSFITKQVLIVLAFIFVILFSFYSLYRISKNDAMTIGKTTVNDISEKLDGFFSEKTELLFAAAETVDFLMQSDAPSTQIKSYLSTLVNSYSKNAKYSLTGIYGWINGEYIGSDNWIPEEKYDPTFREWYIAGKLGNGKISMVTPHLESRTNKIVISISKLLKDGNSVLSIDLDIDAIQKFGMELKLNSEYDVFLLDRDGLVVAHSNEAEVRKNYYMRAPSSDERKLTEKIFKMKTGQFDFIFNKQECTVFVQNVYTDWYVVMVMNNHNLAKRIRSNLSYTILGLIFLFVVMIYMSATNFRARYKLEKNAKLLEEYKKELEHRVEDQSYEIDQKAQALVSMQESVIEGMATIIEYRDINTGMHVQNTKKYVLMIANYLYRNHLHPEEVNEKFISMIGNAAAMHDIGKIAVSDEILNAPRKLTDSEFEIMKTHTVVGAGLVRQVFGASIDEDMLRMCVDVVQYHHEKWNGSGYPIGLSGEDIPLSARIMAIADVFDAIVSKRVYKDAVPVYEVFEIIRKDAGTHFDPELAEIFLGMQEEVKAYLQEMTNKLTTVKNAESDDPFDKIETL